MKKEKMYAIFKKRQHLNLYNKLYEDDNGDTQTALQYLSNGRACYPLENLPLFDGETIKGLLGIKPNNILECGVCDAPEWISAALADYDDTDIPLTRTADMFGYTVLETYHNSDSDNFPEVCYFVSPDLISVISDEDYSLYSRELDGIGCAVIAKAGLITKAVILPYVFSAHECTRYLKTVDNIYGKLKILNDTYSGTVFDKLPDHEL